ncbi:methyltransferase domain-containing protein [Streptomyces argenteolus]|uniref:Methyltransferase domain-containing protein n=1 Tax=Streptomyces argenteolus TaxID=67274 RepID=A0ABW6X6S4_9ACTN
MPAGGAAEIPVVLLGPPSRFRREGGPRSIGSGGVDGRSCSPDPQTFGPAAYDEIGPGAAPDAALLASLGCGNPSAVAELREGETVLDLGSGGGLDVILSARRVGPDGRVFGLDFLEEMLALAAPTSPTRRSTTSSSSRERSSPSRCPPTPST